MKIVVYTCVPDAARKGLFRRVRIVVDGAKATSTDAPSSHLHNSCFHRATVHHYIDVSQCDGVPCPLESSSRRDPKCLVFASNGDIL